MAAQHARSDTGFEPDQDQLAASDVTASDFATRIAAATDAATRAGLRGLLVTPGPDLAYLTGYRPHETERLTMLVLAADQQPTMVVPTLERPDAERAPGAKAVSIIDWRDGRDPYPLAAGLIAPGGRYGISDSAWAMHLIALQRTLPGTRYTSLTETLPMLRAVKDERELDRLAAAGAAADAAFDALLGVRFTGRSEVEVASDLAQLLREHGHDTVEFTIVASGPNGANPHHAPDNRVIESGDAVVLDFGGLLDGYGSDTTRTVTVGEPGEPLSDVHEVVRRAQQAAFEAVRPGVPCQDIDRVARQVIAEAGYGDYFVHRTGHGIGLTTHEPPYMVEGESQPLVPGMCFSIEPGIYLPGRLGVRIEDIVTVTADGARRFNNSTRELQVVS